MRTDARHNRVRILLAARQLCVHEGPDVPLEEIASRAGVGIAMLYRRFPSRAALIRAVAVDVMEAL
ncbi:helix-turn-helix domain-containing protein [Streptomyces syringium]|uniref:helix-turn-helix domain-containing protein n=1 Tax=Streptomyces syringium TaxID=76729 RepID=UPI00368F295E